MGCRGSESRAGRCRSGFQPFERVPVRGEVEVANQRRVRTAQRDLERMQAEQPVLHVFEVSVDTALPSVVNQREALRMLRDRPELQLQAQRTVLTDERAQTDSRAKR